MRHTPRPWKWYWKINDGLEADCGIYSEYTYGQAVSICRAPRYEKEEQWEANARLIASAPELLEEHKRWAKILGHIIVTFLQGNYEALNIYSKMKIEYKDGEPWLKSEAIAKAERRDEK